MKAMGGIGIAQADDFSATYYNPANLAFCKKSVIAVGYQKTGQYEFSDESYDAGTT